MQIGRSILAAMAIFAMTAVGCTITTSADTHELHHQMAKQQQRLERQLASHLDRQLQPRIEQQLANHLDRQLQQQLEFTAKASNEEGSLQTHVAKQAK